MPPSDPPTEITLRVKVPPGHIAGSSADEFSLGTVSTSSHVGELRLQIQQLLPSHPNPDRQRLLYAGRALVDNEQTIASALNTRRDTSQNEYVLHLLVKGDQDAVGGQATPGRRGVGNPTVGGGLLSAGQPLEPGHTVRLGGPPGDALPQGLPQGVPQPPYNLHQAQHLAILQQRQAQQMHHMQQMGRQQHHATMGMPQVQGARYPVLPNGMPLMPGQLPQRNGLPTENDPSADQQRPTPDAEGANVDATQQDSTAETGARPAHANNTPGLPQQPQGPHRPISGQGFHVQGVGPNGNRFEIHQQTLNIPFPGQQAQFGLPLPAMPGMGLPFPLPGMAQQPRQPNPAQQANGPSALDRARQNVAEMRQMVDAMRTTNATEEDRARTARLQEHIQAVNDYIDPFGVGRPNPQPRSTSPFPARMAQSMRASPSLGLGPFPPPPRTQPNMIPNIIQNTRQQPLSSSDTTCYLLSSPQGPQALLFSPQHGTYTGSFAGQAATGISLGPAQANGLHRVVHLSGAPGQPAPTPTQPAGAANAGGNDQAGNAAVDPAVAAAQQVAQQINQAQQARAAAQDNALGPMQPLLAHFWLLLRVMIFAYFIIGTNMGWRRPVALAAIGLGFYLIRAGLFGDGGVARRWWDGIVRVEQRPRQQAQAQAQGEAPAAEGEQRPGHLPTPEELAQRLIQERQQALQRAPMHRLREQLRPVERAGALFFASLWPGVGEAHVRAREAEERRIAEEEVEQRRREEEERQRAIEAEQSSEKKDEDSTAATAEEAQESTAEKKAPAVASEYVTESAHNSAQDLTEQVTQ